MSETNELNVINTFVQQKQGAVALACVAMATNTDYDTLLQKYADVPVELNVAGLRNVLWNIPNTYHLQYIDAIMFGSRLYIIQLPSLVEESKLHFVVVDLRGEQPVVLDPNFGIEGYKAYTQISDIKHYVNVIEVINMESPSTEEGDIL